MLRKFGGRKRRQDRADRRRRPANFRRAATVMALAAVGPGAAAATAGTTAVLVKDTRPSGGGYPAELTNVGGTLFYRADDGVHGTELWESDGTAEGTTLVRDVRPGPDGSFLSQFTAMGGTLFFTARDGIRGDELWKSDGTSEGTTLVRDIAPGSDSSFPETPVAVGGTLFFTAGTDSTGRELWKSDGTAEGTTLVRDIRPGPAAGAVQHLTKVDGRLFFAANDGLTGQELWTSDGTAAGTVRVRDINLTPAPRNQQPSGLTEGSHPAELTAVGGTLYFRANDGVTGSELWKSDGTPAGASLVRDIAPGPKSSLAGLLTDVDGTLLFAANDGTAGHEPWRSDGTPQNTTMVADLNPGAGGAILFSPWTSLGRRLLFMANDGSTGHELWRSDPPYTPSTTAQVADILPGAPASFPIHLTRSGSGAFFTAEEQAHGRELWTTDGTAGGTTLVRDIIAGAEGAWPLNLTDVGGTLFFALNGEELWRTRNNEPPDCGAVQASPAVLEPATAGLMKRITLTGATDPDGDPISGRIDAVSQDEPVSGAGEGDDTSPDAQLAAPGADAGEVLLRAERNPKRDGRVYRIAFTLSDGLGGSCSRSAGPGASTMARVSVPRKHNAPAVDQGDATSWNSLTGDPVLGTVP